MSGYEAQACNECGDQTTRSIQPCRMCQSFAEMCAPPAAPSKLEVEGLGAIEQTDGVVTLRFKDAASAQKFAARCATTVPASELTVPAANVDVRGLAKMFGEDAAQETVMAFGKKLRALGRIDGIQECAARLEMLGDVRHPGWEIAAILRKALAPPVVAAGMATTSAIAQELGPKLSQPSDELLRIVKPRALEYPLDAYWQAPSGQGPLARQWDDKPHRLVYDLIAALLPRPAGSPVGDVMAKSVVGPKGGAA